MGTNALKYPHFTTRQQYERAAVHVVNGIMRARRGGGDRQRREAALHALHREMAERFPIPTYQLEWLCGGEWVPSGYVNLTREQGEGRIARRPELTGRLVRDGVA